MRVWQGWRGSFWSVSKPPAHALSPPLRPHTFIDWIAVNPLAGDVIPGADGARKVRWSGGGSGKSGGARVIYFNLTEQQVVLLAAAYAKADRSNMLAADIKKVV